MRLVPVIACMVLAYRALPAAAGEPSIEDMLKEVEVHALKPAGPGTPSGEAAAESEYLKAMKARLQYEVNQKAGACEKRHDYVGMGDLYFDLEKFNEALASWNTALQKSVNDWQVSQGYVHQRLTRLYMLLGQKDQSVAALEEVTKRMPGPWVLHDIDRLKAWSKDYAAHEEEAKDLKEKIAASPKDAEARWKLLELYRESYPMRLDEFLGRIQFRDLFPNDPRVAVSGDCDWRLMELMMHFGITDEGMKMAEKFREKFPKSGLATGGECCWRLGDWSSNIGRPLDAIAYYKEVREKYPKHWSAAGGEVVWRSGEIFRGLKRWQEAMDCFKEVREKFNKHWSCNPAPGQRATIDDRIFEATKNGAR
jgi:tetratricopeptide (TPR) repeat protein